MQIHGFQSNKYLLVTAMLLFEPINIGSFKPLYLGNKWRNAEYAVYDMWGSGTISDSNVDSEILLVFAITEFKGPHIA